MTSRRRSGRHGLRMLGIAMLILSTVRVPLPQADYHNIRHHDAPGEVCVYHDHLLRWHPTADRAADVAMLHWHWFAPLVEPGAGPPGSSDEPRPANSGPALHAFLGDWPAPDWTGTSLVQPDVRGRFLDRLALGLVGPGLLDAPDRIAAIDPGILLMRHRPEAWIGARAGILSRNHRWNC